MKASSASADVHVNEDLIGRQVHINKEHMEWGNSKHNRTELTDLNTTEFNLFKTQRFPTKMYSDEFRTHRLYLLSKPRSKNTDQHYILVSKMVTFITF